jgi:hypothetical protein
MDFRSRGGQVPVPPTNSTTSSNQGNAGGKKFMSGKWLERSSFVLLLAIAIIILAVAGLTFFSGNSEAKSIQKDRYQAVFLNNGQVYFGNIHSLSNKYIDLQNIYYLQTNNGATDQQASSNTNVSLVKLGCELHAPYDQMVINRDQVIFWENLKDSSQVVKAIADYKKNNPNGQTCNNSSNSTQQAPNTSTQESTSPTNNSSTNDSNSSTKKP